MNGLHICIFTQSHLVSAPRVVKEANVYAKAGYRVTVYAIWHDAQLLDADRRLLEPTITYKAGVNLLDWNGMKSKVIRLRRLLGRQLVKFIGIQTPSSLGYGYGHFLKQLEQVRADVYIGHQEQGMLLAKALIQSGKSVAFDFEDWHSKDLLPKDRVYRPIKLLERLENFLMQHAIYCYTTSEAMAEAMAEFHQAPRPGVVYNSFRVADRQLMDHQQKDVKQYNTPSVYWFSQVIGEGRGLELLFEALPMVKTPFQLHLRGRVDALYKKALYGKTSKHIELYFHEVVTPTELISRIAEHDLGIAFEENHPENKNYTISNKVFHYLQSGIPILATETLGQLEVANYAPNTLTMVPRDPSAIAKALDLILNDPNALKLKRSMSWENGAGFFSFENQEVKLLGMLDDMVV